MSRQLDIVNRDEYRDRESEQLDSKHRLFECVIVSRLVYYAGRNDTRQTINSDEYQSTDKELHQRLHFIYL